jgi:hypothetical protein
MHTAEMAKKFKEILSQSKAGEAEIPMSDPFIASIYKELKGAAVRSELAVTYKIVISFPVSGRSIIAKDISLVGSVVAKPAVTGIMKTQHEYVLPTFHKDVVSIIKDVVPHNVWFVGPTGTGKTEYVHVLAKEMNRTVYQVNGRHDLETSGFLGDKTVKVDEKTGQNYVTFQEGPVIKAMKTGLDDNGNEVGEAAILFVDEVASLPSYILIALNRILETRKEQREIALDGDGGRVVKSHKGFRIICAANTTGRGFTGANDSLYTAQGDALDISTLNRFNGVFKFGYNRSAEKKILQDKIGDSRLVDQFIQFRDAIRAEIKSGKLQTPFSTRNIVGIADLYRVLGSLQKAMYFSVMNGLPREESIVYNEVYRNIMGTDILATMNKNNDMDYMD